MPGERVTLVGELQGIGENQISNPIFNQLGSTVDYTACDPSSDCTYPSITFDMPDCGGDQEDVKFELVLNINGKPYATPPHAVALKCIDIANEDVESNLDNVKNDTDDSNLGGTSIDDTVKDDTGDSIPEGTSIDESTINADVDPNLGNVKDDTGDSSPEGNSIDEGTINADVDPNSDEPAYDDDKTVIR